MYVPEIYQKYIRRIIIIIVHAYVRGFFFRELHALEDPTNSEGSWVRSHLSSPYWTKKAERLFSKEMLQFMRKKNYKFEVTIVWGWLYWGSWSQMSVVFLSWSGANTTTRCSTSYWMPWQYDFRSEQLVCYVIQPSKYTTCTTCT